MYHEYVSQKYLKIFSRFNKLQIAAFLQRDSKPHLTAILCKNTPVLIFQSLIPCMTSDSHSVHDYFETFIFTIQKNFNRSERQCRKWLLEKKKLKRGKNNIFAWKFHILSLNLDVFLDFIIKYIICNSERFGFTCQA